MFQLVKSELVLGDDNNGSKSFDWYSLSLGDCAESIHTSHERDRFKLQEGIRGLVVPSALRGNGDSTGYASSIFVSKKLQERIKENGGLKRSMEDDGFSSDLMPSKAAFVRPVKKTATSAKHFFGASGKTATATTKIKSKAVPVDKKSASKPKPAKSSVLSFQPKSKDNSCQSIKSASNNKQQSSRDAEKENVLNKSSKAVGNADDFLGDMDDEDNDSDSVNEVDESRRVSKTQTKTKERGAVAANPKKTVRRAYQMHDSDSEEDAEQPVEGDVEKTAKVNVTVNDGAKHRRRRKGLVEKTFTDENGYLYTETQTIWEDVPSDEEDVSVLTNKKSTGAAPGKKAKKVSGPTKAMKQGSLMGFFKKK